MCLPPPLYDAWLRFVQVVTHCHTSTIGRQTKLSPSDYLKTVVIIRSLVACDCALQMDVAVTATHLTNVWSRDISGLTGLDGNVLGITLFNMLTESDDGIRCLVNDLHASTSLNVGWIICPRAQGLIRLLTLATLVNT